MAQAKSYIMTFYTTTHTMQVYAAVKDRLAVAIMPVPREISASCGLAIQFRGEDADAFCACFDRLQVPSRLFCLDQPPDGGGRNVTLVGEHRCDNTEINEF